MSAQEEQQPAVRPAPGMTVSSRFNAAWGSGTVMLVQGESARVLFTAHPDRKPVVVPVKSLVVTRAGEWEAAVKAAHEAARATTARANSRTSKKKAFSTTTQEESVRLFLERYPEGFAGTAYTTAERDPKWQAHVAFQEQLGGALLGSLLDAGKVAEVAKLALRTEQKNKLVSVFEKARLAAAFRDEAYATAVFRSLAEVLSRPAPEETSFTRYLEAIAALPATPGQRPATWPMATLLPFLAAPDRFILLKPRATQAAAERLKFDVQYKTELNWNTYRRALQLSADLQAQLAGHGCRDLLDVQSFMWLMA